MSYIIKNLPREVQEIALLRQQEQGNTRDPEKMLINGKDEQSFTWRQTPEGQEIWEEINDCGNYRPFYQFHKMACTVADVTNNKHHIVKSVHGNYPENIINAPGIILDYNSEKGVYLVKVLHSEAHSDKDLNIELGYDESEVQIERLNDGAISVNAKASSATEDLLSLRKLNKGDRILCKDRGEFKGAAGSGYLEGHILTFSHYDEENGGSVTGDTILWPINKGNGVYARAARRLPDDECGKKEKVFPKDGPAIWPQAVPTDNSLAPAPFRSSPGSLANTADFIPVKELQIFNR